MRVGGAKELFWHTLLVSIGGIFCTETWLVYFFTTNSVKHDYFKNKLK